MTATYLRIYTNGEMVRSSLHPTRDAARREWERLVRLGLYERPFDSPVISEVPTRLAFEERAR